MLIITNKLLRTSTGVNHGISPLPPPPPPPPPNILFTSSPGNWHYHYTKITFVHPCVCVLACEYDSGRLPFNHDSKTFFFFAKLQLDATSGISPTLPAKVLLQAKGALLQSVVQKLNHEVGLRVAARRMPKSSS